MPYSQRFIKWVISTTFEYLSGLRHQLDRIECKLKDMEVIMASELETLRAAFSTVNAKLDELAANEAEEAADLQNISDDLDRLLSTAAEGKLTPEDVASAQALADRVAAHAVVSKANSAFAKATAAKVSDPVPLPVPEPPPVEG